MLPTWNILEFRSEALDDTADVLDRRVYECERIKADVGANDERCPPGHSRTLYRALKEYLNVPTELLVYPGEAHGLMKYRSRQAKLEWDLAWLDRYVLGKK